ncbi:unnamed protein product [Rotaria sordida]|uniref:Uncharacterized protein n=1 Tax=Rotaria sordida TaxID=392033 RepID=A0A820HU35_9BILA|nr:unnamed protein product [Rotaria sordida]
MVTSFTSRSSIFDNITTEEQLIYELDAPNSLNLIDDECQQEGQGDAIDYNKQNDNNNNDNNINNNDNEQNDNEQDIKDLNTFINNTSISLNNRIKITDAIRQNAREGQKREANQFLQSTIKKKKLASFNVGDNVASI